MFQNLLGAHGPFSLKRVVDWYTRKYDASQPRDNSGRWSQTSGPASALHNGPVSVADAYHIARKALGNDPAVIADFNRVLGELDASIKNKEMTNLTKSKNGDGTGGYLESRKVLHRQIMDHLFKDAADFKPENGEKPTLMLLGGRGGSGKSNFDMGSKGGGEFGVYDKKKFLHIDSDAIKEMIPEYNPEKAFLVHAESSHIAHRAIAEARKRGINVVVDQTMRSDPAPLIKRFQESGYSTQAHYMYKDPKGAVYGAVERWNREHVVTNPLTHEVKVWPKGRLVPPDVIANNLRNESHFDKIIKRVDKWSLVRNNARSGFKGQKIARGVKKSEGLGHVFHGNQYTGGIGGGVKEGAGSRGHINEMAGKVQAMFDAKGLTGIKLDLVNKISESSIASGSVDGVTLGLYDPRNRTMVLTTAGKSVGQIQKLLDHEATHAKAFEIYYTQNMKVRFPDLVKTFDRQDPAMAKTGKAISWYAKSFWDDYASATEAHEKQDAYFYAVQETLAEMAMMSPAARAKKASPAWNRLYSAVNKAYDQGKKEGRVRKDEEVVSGYSFERYLNNDWEPVQKDKASFVYSFKNGVYSYVALNVAKESLATILKANPYKDALGRWTSKEKAVTTVTFEKDMASQMKWLAGKAKENGKAGIEELVNEAPDIFQTLGIKWRQHHTFKSLVEVLKGNPYHDQGGMFTSKDKAVYQSGLASHNVEVAAGLAAAGMGTGSHFKNVLNRASAHAYSAGKHGSKNTLASIISADPFGSNLGLSKDKLKEMSHNEAWKQGFLKKIAQATQEKYKNVDPNSGEILNHKEYSALNKKIQALEASAKKYGAHDMELRNAKAKGENAEATIGGNFKVKPKGVTPVEAPKAKGPKEVLDDATNEATAKEMQDKVKTLGGDTRGVAAMYDGMKGLDYPGSDHEFLARHSKAYNDLSQVERGALSGYTGSAFTEINHTAVGSDKSGYAADSEKYLGLALSKNTLGKNVLLRRNAPQKWFWKALGLPHGTREEMSGITDEQLHSVVGKTYTETAYSSTTMRHNGNMMYSATGQSSGGLLMRIRAHAGIRGIAVDGNSNHGSEREVVLDKGLTYVIRKVTRRPNDHTFPYEVNVDAIGHTG